MKNSEVIIIAVEPLQIDRLLKEIASTKIPVVRAVPNTAIAARASMTCIASDATDDDAMAVAKSIFDTVGKR